MKSVGGVETENYGFWVEKPCWMASAQQMVSCCMHEKCIVKVTCSLKVPALYCLPYLLWSLPIFGQRCLMAPITINLKKIKAVHWFKIDSIFICSAPGNPCYFVVVFFPSVPRCAGARSRQTSFCYFHKPSYWIIERGKCLTCFYKFLAALLWSATVCWVWKKHSVASPDNDASP